LADEDGFVGFGGSLSSDYLLAAYRAGCFPWSSRPFLNWWSPDPRMIFPLASFRPHRSVQKTIRRRGWTFSIDRDFLGTVRACASRNETWIDASFQRAYSELHRLGHAHSVEVYEGARLVGGLYGVSVGGFFGGESMFHFETDASKAAVGYLVERLSACGFLLCDAQAPTPHLASLGAIEVSRAVYLEQLQQAVSLDVTLHG
jgi:leucyl/phenylalanyl-tRNA--protein transferase